VESGVGIALARVISNRHGSNYPVTSFHPHLARNAGYRTNIGTPHMTLGNGRYSASALRSPLIWAETCRRLKLFTTGLASRYGPQQTATIPATMTN
jgi:hypothetical protein